MMELKPLCKVLAFLVTVSAVPAVGSEKSANPDGAAVDVKVEGAVLRYAPLEIPKSKRTARGEMGMLERATATLEVEKTIALRRSELPAGSYDVRVEVEAGKSYYLVIEAKTSVEGRTKDSVMPRAAKRKPTSGNARPTGALEKKEETKIEEAEKAPRADRASRVGPMLKDEEAGAGDAPMDDEAGSEPRATRKAGEDARAKSPAAIRAPLVLSACEKRSDRVELELKSAGKGSKLRVVVRAGGTEARTTLRFGGKERK